MRRYPNVVAMALVLLGALAMAHELDAREQDLDALRRRIEEQQKQVEEQAEALRRQQAELATLAETLAALSGRSQDEAAPSEPPPSTERDAVGDLNAEAVSAGDFPGAILIPGTERVSLAIGGFVKTVAYGDSSVEGVGPIFLPATIGPAGFDEVGSASIDATLSRVNVDARAPTPGGDVRAYIEWDLNATNRGTPAFNLRHAYGAWRSSAGTLTLGHTWSTLMDLQILPEGLTEPTLSGAIFQRQAQLRWAQPFSERFRADFALESASNRDVITDAPVASSTHFPDVVVAGQRDWPGRGHVRVSGIYRRLRIADLSANGWALSTGAHLIVLGSDKIGVSASYGEGIGRYLLGLPGTLGAVVDPVDGELKAIRGWGGLATYRHTWSKALRSTVGFGAASIDLIEGAPADAFRGSVFGMANLMISPLPYLTYGFEVQYGTKEEQDGRRKDNHRFIFGVQIF